VTWDDKMGLEVIAVWCITANGTNSGEWIDKERLDDDDAAGVIEVMVTEPMAGDLGGVPNL
jgi:hypothetical protein